MTDYAVFTNPHFDPNDYANAVLAGEPYPPSSDIKTSAKTPTNKSAVDPIPKEDISVAISKLTFGIDDVAKQIKTLVTAHHEDLLSQTASVNSLSGSLTSLRSGLNDLDASVDKLRNKIHFPYEALQTNVSRLQKLHQASDLLRRTSRFVILARRLQLQMNEMAADEEKKPKKQENVDEMNSLLSASVSQIMDVEDERERTIAKAALSIAELMALLDGPIVVQVDGRGDRMSEDASQELSLRSVRAVATYEGFIEDSRTKVTSEMENMVLTGLTTLNQTLLASSLQTAYNLRVLPTLVQSLIFDLSQAVEDRIRNAFDLSKISKDALAKDPGNSSQSPTVYRSRVRTEPTNITAPQWTAALWGRLEAMFEEMADCCIKVYTLEKVLKMKKDTTSHVVFLDEAMKVLENRPSATFWTTLGRSLEKHFRDSAKSSTFLQQTLGTGYPRLLRLFQEFFSKIAVHTDTTYTDNHQSPETVLALRALSTVESLYLSKSTNKLNDVIGQAFSGGARTPPGANEGIHVARTIANELDSARFDPLLVKAVAKIVASSLETLISRTEGLVVRDRSAVTLQGPSVTAQQLSNAQLTTFLYQCCSRLTKLKDEHTEIVFAIVEPGIQQMYSVYERLVEPLMTAIRRELGAIITKLHRIDFVKSSDPMSGMGGASLYTKELTEKLGFIKTEIFSRYNVGDAGRDWTMSIVKFVIRIFLLHISIVKPLGESGKLQMTSDMTELEFALSAFMVENPQSQRGGNLESVGDEYRSLRAMRPLLFLDNQELASTKHTAGLPPLIVLHHILVRSPIPLPHILHGWQEAEYVRWVDEHSEPEAWTLVEGGLSHWEKISEAEGKDTGDAKEYIELARAVLKNAQSES